MSQVIEYIKIALMNIKSNRGRSILTMLGIIIGIASVIMIISVGNGISKEMNSELNAMAGGQIYLYIDNKNNDQSITMNQNDFDAIEENIDHVIGATPDYMWYGGKIEGRKGNLDASIEAGNENLEFIYKRDIIKGKYFTAADNDMGNKVCVISESGAKALFGTSDVIGMTVNVTLYDVTQELRIVGIREDDSSTLLNMMNGQNARIQVEVPINLLNASYGFWLEDFQEVLIITEGNEYCAPVARDAIRLIETRHNIRGENIVQVQSFAEQMGQINGMMDMLTMFVVLIAAISLLVGGIGVMNIMLVSVTERTREIGIRKALGARTSSILLQFLSESAIITLLGGIIGIAIGIVGAFAACAALGFSAHVKISTVLGASLFSSAVGIFFGMYPAKRAAKLSPIEALRHE
ncbi:MAG: ABC transporter permease [Lachnospiraceae bacterium]|nr:ABC transporter permease [Lachnospiraceae bacterium]